MNLKQLIVILLLYPIFLWSQKKTFSLEGGVGLNFSFNKMKLLEGTSGIMNNYAQGGGLWTVKTKYQFSKKCLLEIGIEQAAYKYGYHYSSIGAAGGGSSAKVFVWGFPLGLETNWFENDHLSFSTGIGLKYRLNRLGSPFNLNATTTVHDDQSRILYVQKIEEFDNIQNDHLIAAYSYLEFCAKLKNNFSLNFSLGLNLGINKHEMFKFSSNKTYSASGKSEIDRYQYFSRASYLYFGVGLAYSFLSKKEKEAIAEIERSNY